MLKGKDIAIAVILLIAVMADAARDAYITRQIDWISWHLIKWISFYPGYVIILLEWKRKKSYEGWFYIAGYAALCWALWRIVYSTCTTLSF